MSRKGYDGLILRGASAGVAEGRDERGGTVLDGPHEFEPFGEPARLSFGPYAVLGQLGSGGMGTVYRALDTRLERQVAIKVLHREVGVSGPRERFLREARLVSKLNHPNICTIFDIGEQDGDPYLVMELLEGESLKERMVRGPVSAEDIREIAFRAGLALEAAHAKGIIHRDIKPANLFLMNDGRGAVDVKVLDFGLAKQEAEDKRFGLTDGQADGLTRVGATVGTVEYMSPEQACGEPLDVRSDLFSLGAVLYEMATGTVPFRGATSAVIFSELLNRDPVPPREKNLNVPADLDRLIRALLTKDRERRTPSAAQMLEALSEQSSEYDAVRLEQVSRVVPQGRPAKAPLPPREAGVHATVKKPSGGVKAASDSRLGPLVALRGQVSRPATGGPAELLDPQPAFGSRHSSAGGRAAVHADRAGASPVPLVSYAAEKVSTGWKVAIAAGVVVVLLMTLLLILLSYRRPSVMASLDGALQVMPIVNQTGDAELDRAPTVAMELLLAESPRFTVRPVAAADVLAGGTTDTTQQHLRSAIAALNGAAGQRLGVLSGTLSHADAGYVLALRAVDASSGATLVESSEQVPSLAEIPVLLGRSATRLRVGLGEPEDAVGANEPGLAEEASATLPALASFGMAEAEAAEGEAVAAVLDYRRALVADARFQIAEVRLAEALRGLHAEAQANVQIRVLRQQPAMGGAHLRNMRTFLLADFPYGSTPDGQTAAAFAERWRSARPHDVEAQRAVALEAIAEGRYGEAMKAAGEAVALESYRRENQDLLSEAEISAGHADAAWESQARAYRHGAGSAEMSLAAAYLRGDRAGIEASRANLGGMVDDVEAAWAQAVYLANVGSTAEAAAEFSRMAALAARSPEVASAAKIAEARGRLIRSLGGDCAVGGGASEEDLGGLADAWCGLRSAQVESSSRTPQRGLAAAVGLWRNGDLRAALNVLDRDGGRGDLLAMLVRGRLHSLLGEPAAAIAAYKAVAAGRGAAYLAGVPLYPVALAGLAGVYASTGDRANSESSAAALRAVWPDSGPVDRLLRSLART